jgi:peptidoglycan/xylan/chitin deacetylase (PgdA/CDA1 family)
MSMYPASIPVLTYHQITDQDPPDDPARFAVSRKQFARQMAFLHDRGYQCLPPTTFLAPPDEIGLLPKRAFVLTFDDGYANFLENAYPVLDHFGFTAALFVVTDYVGQRSSWGSDQGTPLLNWDQIRFLHRQGVTIGSHTCTHPRLSRLLVEDIRRELSASKAKIEAELDHEAALLAYPYGDSNDRVQSLAREIGYQAAFAVTQGDRQRFNLWRCLSRTDDNLFTLVFKLSSLNRRLKWLKDETTLGQTLRRLKRQWLAGQG